MKIVVIGGGPGGYEAALYAAKRGAEVTLIEKDKVGGTCLNRGCIPTKAYLASYEVVDTIQKADDFGINIDGDYTIDYPAVLARKNKVMESLVKGIHFLCKQNKVTILNGTGTIKDKNTVEVALNDGTSQIVDTDYIILATGSVPVCPPMFKVDRQRVITSDEILDFDKAPESLVIVGGGVIGCEIGQFMNKMGTDVTIVEAMPRLMATMDEDVSKQIVRQFKKEKLKMITGDGIAEVKPGADSVDLVLSSGKELNAQYVLVAIGRAPFTMGAGLENVGIDQDGKGRVLVDEFLRTNVDNIYAIGDIIDSPQLAHVATKEGFIAVDNIFGANKKATYHAVPGCVFTNPQLASVGTLEWQLNAKGKEAGKDYKVGSFDMKALGKAQASGHLSGFVKIIVDMDEKIIGAEVVGANASDMLQVLTTAVQLGLTASQLEESIFPHPTMCEAIMEALHDIHGLSVNKL